MVARTPRMYDYTNNYTNNASATPASVKANTQRLRRRVSKVIREANRRNDDHTNNRYTFDRTNKRVLAKQLNAILRNLNEEVRALKKTRKPTTSRSRKLAYAVAVAGGGAYLYYAQANLILSALPKLAAVAKGIYPASSKVWTVLKSLPGTVAKHSDSLAIKNKATKAYKAVSAVVTSKAAGVALTGASLYNAFVPNGVKTRVRSGAKVAKNYAAPYLAKLWRANVPKKQLLLMP